MQKNPDGEANTNGYRADGFLVFCKKDPGILYAALMNRQIIVSLDIRTGEEKILAGSHAVTGWVDGPGAEARFNNPRQMALDNDGNLIIADMNNHCIRKLNITTGEVSTIAGYPISGYVDGLLNVARFNQPFGVAVDPKDGSIYVGDSQSRRIRKIIIN
jgi:sugar lactone lactonase YvrE